MVNSFHLVQSLLKLQTTPISFLRLPRKLQVISRFFMVNTGEKVLTVNLKGMPDGIYTQIQTTETELETALASYQVPNDHVSLQIPAKSIHVLSARKP